MKNDENLHHIIFNSTFKVASTLEQAKVQFFFHIWIKL